MCRGIIKGNSGRWLPDCICSLLQPSYPLQLSLVSPSGGPAPRPLEGSVLSWQTLTFSSPTQSSSLSQPAGSAFSQPLGGTGTQAGEPGGTGGIVTPSQLSTGQDWHRPGVSVSSSVKWGLCPTVTRGWLHTWGQAGGNERCAGRLSEQVNNGRLNSSPRGRTGHHEQGHWAGEAQTPSPGARPGHEVPQPRKWAMLVSTSRMLSFLA